MRKCGFLTVLVLTYLSSCIPSGHFCAPGATQECTCEASVQGTQICRTDGSMWEPCLCGISPLDASEAHTEHTKKESPDVLEAPDISALPEPNPESGVEPGVAEMTPPEPVFEAPAMPETPVTPQDQGPCRVGQTRPCYTGPAQTKGQGNCIDGTQSCANGQWSACQGEVTPQAEICDKKDNDCDGQVDEDDVCEAAMCKTLAPTADPAANHKQITTCLNKYGYAYLQAGSFPVSTGIKVPPKATLKGLPNAWPTILFVANPKANFLLSLTNNVRVSQLKLDAGNWLNGQANAAIVSISGNDNLIDNNHIFNTRTPAKGDRAAGVYVIGATSTGNVVDNNQIYQAFYGVIFRGGLTKKHINKLQNNKIFDIKCDSVSFAGYGEVRNNTIYHNGWDCENGPIPGGGIYALDHDNGGVVEGNTIYDVCGHGIDMDGVSNFTIRGNTISNPGYQWGGKYPYCHSASGIAVIDMSHSLFEKNKVSNNNRPTNRVSLFGDPNAIFSRLANQSFSDLPHGGKQTIAFVLARRRNGSRLTIGNTIRDNQLVSYCTPATVCVGLGYFATRGTGFDAKGAWSAATTNYFTKNNPNGSQVGSKRCGGNWYAANDTCNDPATGDCNIDDYQHPTTVNWSRNDNCSAY